MKKCLCLHLKDIVILKLFYYMPKGQGIFRDFKVNEVYDKDVDKFLKQQIYSY